MKRVTWTGVGLIFVGLAMYGALKSDPSVGLLGSLAAASAAIFGLGILIVLHEFGHYIGGRIGGFAIASFQVGFGPPLWSFLRGETEWKLCPIPLGGAVSFIDLAEDSSEEQLESIKALALEPGREGLNDSSRWYKNRPLWAQALTIALGPVCSLLTAVPLLAIVFAFWGINDPDSPPRIEALVKQLPAEKAGIKKDDLIVAINGRPVKSIVEVSKEINGSTDSVVVRVARDQQELDFSLEPLPMDNIKVIGTKFQQRTKAVSLSQVLPLSFSATIASAKQQFSGILALLTGRLNPKNLSGPIGILGMSSSAATQGPRQFLSMMAGITIALAVFNILPIPILDGGHLVCIGIRAVFGRNAGDTFQNYGTIAGVAVLLLLFGLGMFNDVTNLF